MSKPDLLLSPSEVFLIGRCLEEYLQGKRFKPKCYFLEYVRECLMPFAPIAHQTSHREFSYQEVPSEVVWQDGDDDEVGFAESFPMSIFRKNMDRVAQETWIKKKSLVSLLIDVVGDAIAFSEYDKFEFRVEPDHDSPKALKDYLGKLQQHEGEALFSAMTTMMARPVLDDETMIEKRIEELVRQNHCEDVFRAGRIVGRILAVCQRCEETLFLELHGGPGLACVMEEAFDIEYDDTYFQRFMIYREGLLEEVASNLAELQETIASKSMQFSRWLFEHNGTDWPIKAARWALFDEDIDMFTKDRVALADVRSAIWLCIGEILTSLKEADQETYEKDASSPSPRMLALRPDARSEYVGGHLYLAEREFNDHLGQGLLPEVIVSQLGNAIEALARETWQSAFTSTTQRGQLDKVLDNKSRSENPLEKRFANIARTLYKSYRNPMSHEADKLDKFRYSWDDARFFVSGIRNLKSLSDELKKQP